MCDITINVKNVWNIKALGAYSDNSWMLIGKINSIKLLN